MPRPEKFPKLYRQGALILDEHHRIIADARSSNAETLVNLGIKGNQDVQGEPADRAAYIVKATNNHARYIKAIKQAMTRLGGNRVGNPHISAAMKILIAAIT